jgi:hypothetical protein
MVEGIFAEQTLTAASSKVTRRAIILFVGAAFANVMDSWKATLLAPE